METFGIGDVVGWLIDPHRGEYAEGVVISIRERAGIGYEGGILVRVAGISIAGHAVVWTAELRPNRFTRTGRSWARLDHYSEAVSRRDEGEDSWRGDANLIAAGDAYLAALRVRAEAGAMDALECPWRGQHDERRF